jgi:diguanylate cyclase (GGDEF)-like protein
MARPAEYHVSGLYTQMLIKPLVEELSTEAVREILDDAGDDRSIDALCDTSTWSSYDQFRRLLVATKHKLDSLSRTDATGLRTVIIGNTEMVETAQGFGSPSSLFLEAGADNPLLPIRHYETTQVGPTEWLIGESFTEGFAPYPEFCEFSAGLFAVIPMIFGLPAAEVVEERCQCRGDRICQFRVTWVDHDDASQIEFLRVRAQLLEARLGQLHDLIEDLATNERYEDVLDGIVSSSLRAVGAGGALLVVDPRAGAPRRLVAKGLNQRDAESLADDLAGGPAGAVFAVPVVSARHRYGALAVNGHGGVFAEHSRDALLTYARLAAAALDSADALESARRETNSARVLLELSSSLSRIATTGEVVAQIVDAVPALIDCDRVAIFLSATDGPDAGTGEFRLAASSGYPTEVTTLLRNRPFDSSACAASHGDHGISYTPAWEFGTIGAITAPIRLGEHLIGHLVAGVTTRPERLTITTEIAERLKGLAAQAAISLSNARLVDQIRHQAVHDALTGLPNRSLVLDRAEQMLARAERSFVPMAALFVDLDGFKDVNDSFGHGVGDLLLKAVTARLATTMRSSDTVGRLGGDEFVILVEGGALEAGGELVAERILAVLRAPFEIDGIGVPLRISASIGVATGVRHSAAELLRDADIALYQAKAAGKDQYVVFEPEMHAAVVDHHQLESDLHEALALGQFFLDYQPIFNLHSGVTTGVEALLRWQHPARGIMAPDSFIPSLEESGLICDVGRWVLYEACRRGSQWHALGHRIEIAVNVSPRQLETDRLLADVRGALHASGLDARYLTVEITETDIMKNMADVVPRLAELKALGVRIAVDDFGTGYSSLAYLQNLPVDTLKIDRSFVSSIAESSEAVAMVSTLVQLGRSLGLQTLAEGIEEQEQCVRLQREECESGQGFLYARPIPADEVAAFLAERASGSPSVPAESAS